MNSLMLCCMFFAPCQPCQPQFQCPLECVVECQQERVAPIFRRKPNDCEPCVPVKLCVPDTYGCPIFLLSRMKEWCDLSKCTEITMVNTREFVCVMQTPDYTVSLKIFKWDLKDKELIEVANKVKQEFKTLKKFNLKGCSFNYEKEWK